MRAAAARCKCCKDVSCLNERSSLLLLGEETTGRQETALADQWPFAYADYAPEEPLHSAARFPQVPVVRSVVPYLFSAAIQVSFLQWHLPYLEAPQLVHSVDRWNPALLEPALRRVVLRDPQHVYPGWSTRRREQYPRECLKTHRPVPASTQPPLQQSI